MTDYQERQLLRYLLDNTQGIAPLCYYSTVKHRKVMGLLTKGYMMIGDFHDEKGRYANVVKVTASGYERIRVPVYKFYHLKPLDIGIL